MRNPFFVETMNQTVNLARNAMATRFEFILNGDDEHQLRAAGEEALAEIERLEGELGFYQPGSEISSLNKRAAMEPFRVSPLLFELIETAANYHQRTNRAFDITVAPLMKLWGLDGGSGRFPESDEVNAAIETVGMDLLQLNAADRTVHFARPGIMLDLGAIGKGFALDIAADWLREAGVESALLHGGTSTIYAIGAPPGAAAWKVGLVRPESDAVGKRLTTIEDFAQLLRTVELRDNSLSTSAVWGKSFIQDGKVFGHVIDPRTGWPVQGAVMSAVVSRTATETDVLSTALLTLGEPGLELLTTEFADFSGLVAIAGENPTDYTVHSRGF